VLFIDIDHSKSVNDGHGHDAEDAVLREFATRIRRNTRDIDLTCRLGGEEFVLVMPDSDLSPRPITWASAYANASPRRRSKWAEGPAPSRLRRALAWRRSNPPTIVRSLF